MPPIYEYSCPAGHTQEELRSSDDRHKELKCSQCGRPATLQVSPVPGVVKSPAVPNRKLHKPRRL